MAGEESGVGQLKREREGGKLRIDAWKWSVMNANMTDWRQRQGH
jgi:hypothetical protein